MQWTPRASLFGCVGLLVGCSSAEAGLETAPGSTDRQALVLWAHAGGTDESAQVHIDLTTDQSFDLHR